MSCHCIDYLKFKSPNLFYTEKNTSTMFLLTCTNGSSEFVEETYLTKKSSILKDIFVQCT